MGVLLIGLDAIYRFADMFRGTHISGTILIYLREVRLSFFVHKWINKRI